VVDEGVVEEVVEPRRLRGRTLGHRLRRRLHQRRPLVVRRAQHPRVTLEDLTEPSTRTCRGPQRGHVVAGLAFCWPRSARSATTAGGYWSASRPTASGGGGWSDAYFTDSPGRADGPRPIVLSYASSPPSTVPEGGWLTTGAARHLLPADRVRGCAPEPPTPVRSSCSTSCSPTRSGRHPGSMYRTRRARRRRCPRTGPSSPRWRRTRSRCS
jgi:hypothetical protein